MHYAVLISAFYLGVVLVLGAIALIRAPRTDIAAVLRNIARMLHWK
jgi:hypothetical protein